MSTSSEIFDEGVMYCLAAVAPPLARRTTARVSTQLVVIVSHSYHLENRFGKEGEARVGCV